MNLQPELELGLKRVLVFACLSPKQLALQRGLQQVSLQ
jgi:hypothetical protein